MSRPAKDSIAPAHDPLHAYRSKRDFAQTPEPAAGGRAAKDQPLAYADLEGTVSKKVEAGETATVATVEDAPSEAAATNVVDLTELLAKSLAKRKPGGSIDDGANRAAPAKKAAARASTRRRR